MKCVKSGSVTNEVKREVISEERKWDRTKVMYYLADIPLDQRMFHKFDEVRAKSHFQG